MTPYELSALIVSFVLICSAVDVTNYFHQVRYGNCREVSKLLFIIHLGFFFFFFFFFFLTLKTRLRINLNPDVCEILQNTRRTNHKS